MRNDEFNNVKVTNAGPTLKREFGPTPKTEFSSKDESFFGRRDYTVNDNKAVNDENVSKPQEVTTQSTSSSTKKTIDQEQISQASSSGSTSASATATSAASASAAGSVASSVAAAASVIAVTAVSVAAGVTVMQNQNATCRLTDFAIYSNKIEYALVLQDNEVDNFEITVESANYLKTQKIVTGENTGSFEELTAGATYSFYVKEEGFGGKVLLDQEFTTKAAEPEPEPYTPVEPDPVSAFNSLVFNMTADFELDFFTVALDFVDEKNIYSDFEIYLLDLTLKERIDSYQGIMTSEGERDVYPDRTYKLEKTTAEQKLYFNEDKSLPTQWQIDPYEDEFMFEFTYKDNGEKKVGASSDNFVFENIHQPTSEFYGYELSKEADYEYNSIEIMLKYVDDKELFSDFDLYLVDETLKERAQIDPSIPYDAHITLHPWPNEYQSIYLDDIGSAAGSDWVMRVDTDTFSYELTYKLDGVKYLAGSEENITFSEKDTYEAIFYGLNFDQTINMKDYSFEVSLNYYDPRQYFSDFELDIVDLSLKERLSNEGALSDTSQYTRTYQLPLTSAAHQLYLNDGDTPDAYFMDPLEDEFTYELRCREQGVLKVVDQSWGVFTFSQYNAATFKGFDFKYIIDPQTYAFNVELLFEDEENEFSDFQLRIEDVTLRNQSGGIHFVDSTVYPYERYFSLAHTLGEQTVYLNSSDSPSAVTFDPFEHEFSYQLYYTYNGSQILADYSQDNFSFTPSSGAPSYIKTTFDHTINMNTYEFGITLSFDDPYNLMKDFTLLISDITMRNDYTPSGDEETMPFEHVYHLEHNQLEQTLKLNDEDTNPSYMFEPLEHEFEYTLSYTYLGEQYACDYDGPFTFVDATPHGAQFNSLTFPAVIDPNDFSFTVTLDYSDPNQEYSNFTLIIYDEDLRDLPDIQSYYMQIFDLAATTDPQTLYLNTDTEEDYKFQPYSESFTYVLTCEYDGATTELARSVDPFTWSRPSEGASFIGFSLDEQIDSSTNTFSIWMDFVDPDDEYTNFTLVITDEDLMSEQGATVADYTQTFLPAHSTDEQTFMFNVDGRSQEWYFEPLEHQFSYVLTCSYNNNTITLAQSDEPFTFTDPSLDSYFTLSCDYTVSHGYISMVELDYSDDVVETYESFAILIDVYDMLNTMPLDVQKGRQPIFFGNIGDQDILSAFYAGDPINLSVVGYNQANPNGKELWRDDGVTFTYESKFDGLYLSLSDTINESGEIDYVLAYMNDDEYDVTLNLEIYDENTQLLYSYSAFTLANKNNEYYEASGTLNLRRASNIPTNMPSVEEIKANLANPVTIKLMAQYSLAGTGEIIDQELIVLYGVTFS